MTAEKKNPIDNFVYGLGRGFVKVLFAIKESRVLNCVLWRPLGAVWKFFYMLLPWILLAFGLKMLDLLIFQ